jgi:hypothetical protein
MAKKLEKVPETKEFKPNREQRRHREQRPEDAPVAREDIPAEHDVPDPRAKNSGHKKKTADKWNQ